ncbi:MAG: cytochrome c oxidase assembly protein [Pseudomonadota bacterium]
MNTETKRHTGRLTAVVLAMFGFGFALGPLYSAICEAAGINGKMRLAVADVKNTAVDSSRWVNVEFVTTVNGGRPMQFRAAQSRVRVHPGEMATVEFTAQNNEAHDIVAQAVPNVAPWNAARHLRKTECFCFNQQAFKAGETKSMPMRFLIDPELPAEVETITLAYTFFDVTELAQQGKLQPRS